MVVVVDSGFINYDRNSITISICWPDKTILLRFTHTRLYFGPRETWLKAWRQGNEVVYKIFLTCARCGTMQHYLHSSHVDSCDTNRLCQIKACKLETSIRSIKYTNLYFYTFFRITWAGMSFCACVDAYLLMFLPLSNSAESRQEAVG